MDCDTDSFFRYYIKRYTIQIDSWKLYLMCKDCGFVKGPGYMAASLSDVCNSVAEHEEEKHGKGI